MSSTWGWKSDEVYDDSGVHQASWVEAMSTWACITRAVYSGQGISDQFKSHVRFFGSGALSAGGIVRPLESVSAMLTSLGARFPASYLIGPLALP